MTAALAPVLSEQPAFQNDAVTIHENAMDAHVRNAIGRMADWCQRQPQGAEFLARGFVVDTLGDITQQITGYFPGSIDVTPVVDDLSFVVMQQAKVSNQRFQELELAYIADGKMPGAAQANLQSFVKWYSAENVIGGDAQGNHKTLKPGWGGGAGGEGGSLLRHLNLATKKGFLLQVRALDISDAKSKTLLQNLDVVQAFGGSPEALKAAIEIIAKGGPEAASLKAVITQMVEIKTLRAALTNAGDTPGAGPIAAALAIKTESLSAILSTLKVSPAIKAAITQGVETVKIDLQARQIEGVIQTLSNTVTRPSPAQLATTQSPQVVAIAQIARSVEAIRVAAQTHGLPIRDMIAVTIAKTGPSELTAPVRAMTEIMARPEFFPAIEQAIQPRAALNIREALTMPVLQAVAQTPVALPVITNTLQTTANNPAMPPMIASVIAQATVKTTQLETVAPTMRAPVLEAVGENLRGLSMTASVPEAAKPAIIVAAAQVEAITIQGRQPAPAALPTTPQPLAQQSPLEAVATATKVPMPVDIPPAGPKVAELRLPTPESPRANDNVIRMNAPSTPAAKINGASMFATGDAQKKVTSVSDKKEEKAAGPCAGKTCVTCFNKTCMALSDDKVQKMVASAMATNLVEHREKRAATEARLRHS